MLEMNRALVFPAAPLLTVILALVGWSIAVIYELHELLLANFKRCSLISV